MHAPQALTGLTSYSLNDLTSSKKAAFTLAEVLITLAIIGVVAALLIPTLINNYQKKLTISRLKKTFSVLSQAIQYSTVENGDVQTWSLLQEPSNSQFSESQKKNFVENFMNIYVISYIKNIDKSDYTSLYHMGYKNGVYSLDGSNYYSNYEKLGVIKLLDGTIIFITLDVSNISSDENNPDYKYTDFLFIADMNGNAKPNTVGKDIFVFKLDRRSAKLDFYKYDKAINRNDVLSYCKSATLPRECRQCGYLIKMDGWQIKDDYPW